MKTYGTVIQLTVNIPDDIPNHVAHRALQNIVEHSSMREAMETGLDGWLLERLEEYEGPDEGDEISPLVEMYIRTPRWA